MELETPERRAARRFPYIVEANLEGRRSRNDRLSDVSATGAFVETIGDFPAGTTFELAFPVRGEEIRVRVEVRYRMPPVGIGVAFLDLAPDDRARIERLAAGGN